MERYWNKVEKTDGCWIWKAAISKSTGYGAFKLNGKKVDTHRLSLEWKLGRPIAKDMDACHTCDNTACVKPDHLYEGTRKQNVADCINRDRFPIGSRQGQAKLTEKEVAEIKSFGPEWAHVDLAWLYGVSDSTIRNIRKGRWWKHVRAAGFAPT